MRILAVDDDQHFLDLLEAVLGEAGYDDVTCVSSAPDALTEAYHAEGKIDCFLLDVQMPDIDGVDLCRRLRDMKAYRTTPIIMVTALHQKSMVQKCFDAGATDFLNKPLDGLELGARIRTAQLLNDSLKSKKRPIASELSVMNLEEIQAEDAAPITALENVRGLTDSHIIENHMLRNRAGYYILHVLGFSIPGFGPLADTLTSREMRDVLGDAAQVISKSLGNYDFSFSYLGEGRFISLVQGRRFWSTQNVIGEIASILQTPRWNSMATHGATLEVASLSDRRFWTSSQAADAIRAYRNSSAQFETVVNAIMSERSDVQAGSYEMST